MEEYRSRKCVVFLSDFGTVDGAVSAMHAVADEVDETLRLEDLTHEIPQFNIWEASYRLIQALTYWKKGTVFVCVVDPGVGSDRKSVVALTNSGHFIVTPDNGTLTHVAAEIGIVALREIEEASNRLKNSQASYTFHGRDVYAYTAARLAGGMIGFEDVGPELDPSSAVKLDLIPASIENGEVSGNIDILDVRYGSLWSNIPQNLIHEAGIVYGDLIDVKISYRGCIVFGCPLRFCRNFTEVSMGEPLVYINSLLNVGIALNQGNFAEAWHIRTGEGWKIKLKKH
ncbi:MAG: S-adenosyl-l-methionine hydroxide adenosyltransferase family protein [Bullifex sp.]